MIVRPGVTDPAAMYGSGTPSQEFSPPPSNPLLTSMKTEAYGKSFVANFAAKDSAAVNGIQLLA